MSDDIATIKNGQIVCPNHGEPLEGIGRPIPAKGEGMCPVSGAIFAFAADMNQFTWKKDHNGELYKSYSYTISGGE